ncbi:hypothetical protein [Algicella marina]|uniref:DUF2946 domain-containing protein n=1 Tax=Algicella marina TaxID=2683284 RepID=A0A6P1SWJ8_9RHOB|nr:hypothetical protein [Algicella marina]QHQ33851.1 hypothetical protein GO499_00980 [Algicella marina]
MVHGRSIHHIAHLSSKAFVAIRPAAEKTVDPAPFPRHNFALKEMPDRMQALPTRLIALVTALLLAVFSVTSAIGMATAGPADDDLAIYIAAGVDLSDICGAPEDGHNHRCPFCRLVAHPPSNAPVRTTWRLLPPNLWESLADQRSRQLAARGTLTTRAPPALT